MEAVRIPNRALFKAPEVCEIAQVQPYVLRSWEEEFPDLGVSRAGGGPRLYRRADLERVLRLKHLLFVEGLTLSGARRRLEEERAAEEADDPTAGCILVSADVRERLERVRDGLRALMSMLGGDPAGAGEGAVAEGRVAAGSGKTAGERSRIAGDLRGDVAPAAQRTKAAAGVAAGDNGRSARAGRARRGAERSRGARGGGRARSRR
ncbi:MAG TPA: MerR family transcriptional regulator [Vicinamibacterales bacterium]|nr:MerR family transcriptional regulator [Vicinamibacterales bacterium]